MQRNLSLYLYYSSWLNERTLAAFSKPTSNATWTVFEMHAVFVRNADLEKKLLQMCFWELHTPPTESNHFLSDEFALGSLLKTYVCLN